MGDKTGIEWTDATWNPTRGCSRVSEGCRNCYAERVAARFSKPGMPYEGLIARGGQWNGTINLVPEALDQPLRWRRPRRIFVNSMSDLFHEGVPDEYIDRVFAIMSACDRHTFQILTKRPERMRQWFASRTPDCGFGTPLRAGDPRGTDPEEITYWKTQGLANEKRDNCGLDWPLRNVWLGVSVEDQATADERIPLLLQTPAAVRWISAEPLLGPVGLTRYLGFGSCDEPGCEGFRTKIPLTDWPLTGDVRKCYCGSLAIREERGLDWVVVGGESGPGARPMHRDWARSLRDQCAAAGVPFLFKQWGAWLPSGQASAGGWVNDGADIALTKGHAGRKLDGRLHDEYPRVV